MTFAPKDVVTALTDTLNKAATSARSRPSTGAHGQRARTQSISDQYKDRDDRTWVNGTCTKSC